MAASSIPLGEYVNGQIYYGIKTGLNSAFIINSIKRAELVAANPNSDALIKPLVIGQDVRRWQIRYADRYLLYMYHGVDLRQLPAVTEYLRAFKSQLERRATKQEWYELQQPQMRYRSAFEGTKILVPDIAKGLRFALDTTGAFPSNTAYLIPSDDLFLLGVLNSRPVENFYIDLSTQIRGGYLRFFQQYVKQIPIPQTSSAERNAIAGLVKQCLDTGGQGSLVAELEAEIDARIARLYGLPVA